MTGQLKGLRNPRLWDYIAVKSTDSISRGGWYSSFGGKPFSSEEMEQYVSNTKDKLVPYLSQEKKALEIGGASGLTMFEIAPFVKEYIGTDMAKENLRINQEYIESNGISNIKLINCSADKLKEAVHQEMDIIIINSVCQYFPSMEYFEDVIENCISMIGTGV
ncbi:methyltransferase domain-containing protein [Butyrivibrio sp. LC3010]|uniref:methyltransferase domain-containing protein n=1 Tax=Butyrivibrio sp. LC3010 TaxID=1280680 RepID=UPI00047905E5|nr:methyltransferase domain-containing protein [Butyrivibrio sp. LC3010]